MIVFVTLMNVSTKWLMVNYSNRCSKLKTIFSWLRFIDLGRNQSRNFKSFGGIRFNLQVSKSFREKLHKSLSILHWIKRSQRFIVLKNIIAYFGKNMLLWINIFHLSSANFLSKPMFLRWYKCLIFPNSAFVFIKLRILQICAVTPNSCSRFLLLYVAIFDHLCQ